MQQREYHRIRTIIPHLEYGKLSKIGVIPKERFFTSNIVPAKGGGKTPCQSISKIIGPSNYGILVEKIIETLIQNNCNIESLNELKPFFDDDETYKKKFIIKEWEEIALLLRKELKHVKLQIQVELNDDKAFISGHPDLMSDDYVYDIKTTGRFGAMRISTIFQLLSYYCLAKLNGKNVKGIGLILPIQLKVIKNWKWEPFYNELIKTVNITIALQSQYGMKQIELFALKSHIEEVVGFHCKLDKLIECIKCGVPAL